MWGKRTVKIGGSHKRYVNTQVSVIGRTIQTEVDAKGNRRPGWILGATIEADLVLHVPLASVCPRSVCRKGEDVAGHTLLAGFVLNFSKSLVD